MSLSQRATPVIIGIGLIANKADRIIEPISLIEMAARAAFDDTGTGLLDRVDGVFLSPPTVFGALPHAEMLASRLELPDGIRKLARFSGAAPLGLLGDACDRIGTGELSVALVAGGIADASIKRAVARGETPLGAPAAPWSQGSAPGPQTDVPPRHVQYEGPLAEGAAGVNHPGTIFALIESVMAARAGRSVSEQRQWLGTVMAPFTEVAANRPGPGLVPGGPLGRRHLRGASRQPPRGRAVHQADELLSDRRPGRRPGGHLRAGRRRPPHPSAIAGVPLVDRFLHGKSPAIAAQPDRPIRSPRCGGRTGPRPRRASPAPMSTSSTCTRASRPLSSSGRPPSAWISSMTEVSPSPVDCPISVVQVRRMSHTPWPAAVEQCRARPGQVGAVVGVGGVANSFAAAVLSSNPPSRPWSYDRCEDLDERLRRPGVPVDLTAEGPATVAAMTVVHDRASGPQSAPILAEFADGRRTGAAAAHGEMAAELSGISLVGEQVRISVVDGQPRVHHDLRSEGPLRSVGFGLVQNSPGRLGATHRRQPLRCAPRPPPTRRCSMLQRLARFCYRRRRVVLDRLVARSRARQRGGQDGGGQGRHQLHAAGHRVAAGVRSAESPLPGPVRRHGGHRLRRRRTPGRPGA